MEQHYMQFLGTCNFKRWLWNWFYFRLGKWKSTCPQRLSSGWRIFPLQNKHESRLRRQFPCGLHRSITRLVVHYAYGFKPKSANCYSTIVITFRVSLQHKIHVHAKIQETSRRESEWKFHKIWKQPMEKMTPVRGGLLTITDWRQISKRK